MQDERPIGKPIPDNSKEAMDNFVSLQSYAAFEKLIKKIVRLEILKIQEDHDTDTESLIKKVTLKENTLLRESLEEIIDAKIIVKLEPIQKKIRGLLLSNFKIIVAATTIIAVILAIFQIFIFFSPYLKEQANIDFLNAYVYI